jgi:hypothetical protein
MAVGECAVARRPGAAGGVAAGGVAAGGVAAGGVADGGVADGGVADGGVADGGVPAAAASTDPSISPQCLHLMAWSWICSAQ